MASSSDKAKLVSIALNSARNANILDTDDSEDLQSLIEDYLATDSNASEEIFDENATDDDENHEEETGEECSSKENTSANTAPDNSDSGAQSQDQNSDSDSGEEDIVNDTSTPMLHVDISDSVDLNADSEYEKVQSFDCKCKLLGQATKQMKTDTCEGASSVPLKHGCIAQFSTDELLANRLNMAEFNEAEKDNILLGILAGTPRNTGELTCLRPSRQPKRKLPRTSYLHDGKRVCRETFKFIYGISQNKLTALTKHYHENGMIPRVKKWGGRKFNTKSLTPDDTERIVMFLRQFAEDHALLLPGRVPGFKRSDIKILPTSQTKMNLWRHYHRIAQARGHRAVGKSTFMNEWKKHVPYIVVGKPMTDLCWQCKQNNDMIRRAALEDLDDIRRIHHEHGEHLDTVDKERKLYKAMVESSRTAAAAAGITQLGPHAPNSMQATMHYSFDFAQQVHIPSSPLQPGPIYFLVPRKCGIFGVCAEGLPQQINYLIDEGMCSNKGSNMVISLLHHFFEKYGLGETNMDLHCDNCSGQNKNKYMMWYLAWRIMKKLHNEISINFMPAGHTKFAPDWCFGLLKRKFKKDEVHCLDDMCTTVNSSTRRGINRAQLVGTESGEVHVEVYDWHSFFDGWFKSFKGIKVKHHFRFSAAAPGVVYVKDKLDDAEVEHQLAYCARTAQTRLLGMPPVIPPPGLSDDRKKYLRHSIRPFVNEIYKDLVCP